MAEIDLKAKEIKHTLVLDLGFRDYKEVWDLQRDLVDKRKKGEIPDVLILVEHPHVITLGRKAKLENVLTDKLPIYRIERGGDVTYHGPGQLIGYIILDLEDSKLDVYNFVRRLEDVLIKTVSEFGIDAERCEGHAGVWVKGRKLASIGIAIDHWVTYHGFALNVNTDLDYFTILKPCGLDGRVMTSMEKILGKRVKMEDVKERLKLNFSKIFCRILIPFDDFNLK
ncbi:MAG: lipoyl(octanoyl) transferase LipB [Nitrososphaerota archaeon]|nr:lipoyl(octanoyl) transferase LipB [Nitrososphaerota archaeon]